MLPVVGWEGSGPAAETSCSLSCPQLCHSPSMELAPRQLRTVGGVNPRVPWCWRAVLFHIRIIPLSRICFISVWTSHFPVRRTELKEELTDTKDVDQGVHAASCACAPEEASQTHTGQPFTRRGRSASSVTWVNEVCTRGL